MSAAPYGLAADLHLHAWSPFATATGGPVNNRLQMLLDEISRCAAAVSERGGKKVVFAGDVFHVRGTVKPTVLNALRDKLQECHRMVGTEFIILAGNHDIEHRDTNRLGSAVTALECDYVKVINEPTYLGKSDGMRAVLVPWIESITDLKATIEQLGTGTMDKFLRAATDLIIHAPIDGVIEGLPDHGLTPEYLAGLGYKRVFAGHYHNHRSFAGEVHSIGALAHHTWSDVGSKAGFLIVHPDEFVWQCSHLPQFVDLGGLIETCPTEDIPLMVDGNYVRFRVDGSSKAEVEGAREELTGWGAKGVLIQAQPKATVREGVVGASVSSGASLEVSVKEFINGLTLEDQAAVEKAAFDVLAAAEEI